MKPNPPEIKLVGDNPDQKYITFKRSDLDDLLEDLHDVFRGDDAYHALALLEKWALQDSVVIRTCDVFAGSALHMYANGIQIANSVLEDRKVKKRLSQVADYFETRAIEADEREFKHLPD